MGYRQRHDGLERPRRFGFSRHSRSVAHKRRRIFATQQFLLHCNIKAPNAFNDQLSARPPVPGTSVCGTSGQQKDTQLAGTLKSYLDGLANWNISGIGKPGSSGTKKINLALQGGGAHAVLAEHITPFNNALQMPNVASTINLQTDIGRAMMDGILYAQAQIISFSQDFELVVLVTLCAIPLVFIMGSTKASMRHPGADDHAAVLD